MRAPLANNKIFTLADVLPGRKYRIIKIDGGCKLNCRLCALGLNPNEVIYVFSKSRGGPLCIKIKGTKFAIGRGMAQKIIVREAKE